MAEVPGPAAPKERREAELALLQAIYPNELEWSEQRQELTYRMDKGGTLVIRLPNDYPGGSSPVLVSATGCDKTDLRDATRDCISAVNVQPAEEILDALVQAFEELVMQRRAQSPAEDSAPADAPKVKFKTVVIWLHHLLNTNKRKLALNPTVSPDTIKGITKPGHPGVLLYSGQAEAVEEHVAELRNQRWQAFQVRLDEPGDIPWSFVLPGISEVQTMAEVTQNIQSDSNRQAFLEAIGVK